jgi:hypothetical protein
MAASCPGLLRREERTDMETEAIASFSLPFHEKYAARLTEQTLRESSVMRSHHTLFLMRGE